MRIVVVNEVSAADKNKDIIAALNEFDHEIINVGMKSSSEENILTYIDTAFISALLLNAGIVDFVVGGCGTGQGYLNAVMQYPNVFCGLIVEPLDGWLYAQINGGNCVSLALNKGYGWAGNENLVFIFEKLFEAELGCGYPAHRKASQKESRDILGKLSKQFHLGFPEIIEKIDDEIFTRIFKYPRLLETINVDSIKDTLIKDALIKKLGKLLIAY